MAGVGPKRRSTFADKDPPIRLQRPASYVRWAEALAGKMAVNDQEQTHEKKHARLAGP